MWSPRQRRSDPERPPLPAGDAPQRSPSPRYTTTGRGLESGPPRVAEIPPPGAGEERGDATLPPCASARLRGYVTNARALERAAPVAARGRRFPARRGEGAARPRPRPRRPVRPALGARACRFPTLPEPRGPGRRGPRRAPAASVRVRHSISRETRPGARGSCCSLSGSPAPTTPRRPPGERLLARAAQSRLRTRPLPAPRPPRRRLDLLGWRCAGRALRTTPGALPEPHTPPLRRGGKDRGQGGEPSADRAAGPGLLARVPASGADSAGIFKLSLLGLLRKGRKGKLLWEERFVYVHRGLPAS